MCRPHKAIKNAYTKEENANIEVYITNLPSAPYIELAQITCDDTEDDWCLKQIKIKAREIIEKSK